MDNHTLHQLLDTAQRRDPIGDHVHLAVTGLYLFTLPIGPAPEAIAFGVLAVYSTLRIWVAYRSLGRLFVGSPLMWILLATSIWTIASLAWSVNRIQGVDEIYNLRSQWPIIIFIWPILTKSRFKWLSYALGFGVLIAAAVQVGQHFNFEWCEKIGFHGIVEGRSPGLLHPSLTAILAMTAGGTAIANLVGSQSGIRRKLTIFVFLLASIISLSLTGSRGPTLAAIVAWPIVLFTSIWIGSPQTSVKRRLGLAAITVIVFVAFTWSIGSNWSARFRPLVDETHAALTLGEYRSDVGARIMQAKISTQLFRTHPMLGVGAGSYFDQADRAFRSSDSESDEETKKRVPVRNHPHSALLYAFVIIGLPGGILYLAFWFMLAISGFRTALHSAVTDPIAAAAPGLIVGLFIAFAVDSQNLSAPGMTVLMLVTAFVIFSNLTHKQESAFTTPTELQLTIRAPYPFSRTKRRI